MGKYNYLKYNAAICLKGADGGQGLSNTLAVAQTRSKREAEP